MEEREGEEQYNDLVLKGMTGKIELKDATNHADKYRESGNSALEFVMRGVSGENEGLYNGLDRNTKTYGGVLKARYYLIGASSGVGKTTFADWTFLIAPYLYYRYHGYKARNGKEKKMKWIYFSFEISRLMKELSFITLFMNVIYDKEISLEQLTGENGVIDDYETLSQIEECHRMVNDMLSEVIFIENTMTPFEMSTLIEEYARESGQILNANDPKKIRYVRNKKHEGETTMVIVDSLNLVGREKGQSPKEAMDELSNLAVAQRNFFGFTYCIIQQFNNNLVGLTRQEFSGRGGTGTIGGIVFGTVNGAGGVGLSLTFLGATISSLPSSMSLIIAIPLSPIMMSTNTPPMMLVTLSIKKLNSSPLLALLGALITSVNNTPCRPSTNIPIKANATISNNDNLPSPLNFNQTVGIPVATTDATMANPKYLHILILYASPNALHRVSINNQLAINAISGQPYDSSIAGF